jgi:hypothetical protein
VFEGPRVKFIFDNFDKSYEQLAEISGPPDLPNQFIKTYQVARELKKNVAMGQSLFLASGNRDGLFRSVMTQVLFSQNLVFVDDPNFRKYLEKDKPRPYVVIQNDGEDKLCGRVEAKALGETGFVVCKLDKFQLDLLK